MHDKIDLALLGLSVSCLFKGAVSIGNFLAYVPEIFMVVRYFWLWLVAKFVASPLQIVALGER